MKKNGDGFYETEIAVSALQADELQAVVVEDQQLLLTLVDNRPVAFTRRCPHASGDLANGGIRRGRVTCLDHGYKFDVCTGRTLWPEDEMFRLTRYQVRVRSNQVEIKLQRL